ncbi:MAG: helix-turn-helix domain-containing protein [Amylibacter sp.]|nr:helix-turn-helix domain-containing protein [Amylibacter sp.]
MTTFGTDLIQSLNEAIAHAKGQGPAIVHYALEVKKVREKSNLTQKDMAALMGVSLSGYRKWEQDVRKPRGPALTLLRVMDKNPQAVIEALG